MTKAISILGSTGSIGRQTLDVADDLGLRVAALSANRDVDRMEAQCRKYRPELAVLMEESAAKALKVRLADTTIRVASGMDGLLEAATLPTADTVVTAVSGMIGLRPTLAAIRERKRIALANKETLVCAGELVMQEAARCGAEIIPVDSEHSAIFQCLMGCRDQKEVRRLILTCSGGPFFGMTREALAGKTKDDALKHPNWKMGPKITVDCATLMNKGLEVIEAMRLLRPAARAGHGHHPPAVGHPLARRICRRRRNGAARRAGYAHPDRPGHDVSHAAAQSRRPRSICSRAGTSISQKLTRAAFPCFALAKQAARIGGTACAAMNAANEAAVARYLRDEIGFYDIPAAVERALTLPVMQNPTLDDILAIDAEARRIAAAL